MDKDKKGLKEKLERIKKEAEERAAQRLAEKLGKDYIDIAKTPIGIEAVALIDEEEAKKSRIVAIEKKRDKLAAVSVNPQNPETQKTIKNLESQGFNVSVFIVSPSGLQYALTFYKFVSRKAEEITGRVQVERKSSLPKENLNSLEKIKSVLSKENFSGSRANDILEIILNSALINRASDIHLEPTDDGVKLRFRIDGLLHDIFNFPKDFYPFLLSRIKLFSNLKLNIKDEPQDGRFTIKFIQKDVEVRVAVAPAQFGEVVVMRILDPDAINLNLADLGLREDDLKIIEKELKQPNGMILNTGPTGSGKTTTLYSFLKYKKNPEIKIITIEDPIEYELEGIEQTQVDEESGYNFANGLKSLMRQDPDVILVGEIRDKETAEIGMQAALTGHLVFSTIHANSASGAIPRLLDLGVKAVSIGPALNLIIAQRLVRRLCAQCKTPATITEDLKNKINNVLENLPDRVNKEKYKDIKIFNPPTGKECENCNGTGHKGRVAIYELLLVEPEIEELILKQTGEASFYKFAKEHQTTTIQEDGILKVISGITTFDEVESATGPIDWEKAR